MCRHKQRCSEAVMRQLHLSLDAADILQGQYYFSFKFGSNFLLFPFQVPFSKCLLVSPHAHDAVTSQGIHCSQDGDRADGSGHGNGLTFYLKPWSTMNHKSFGPDPAQLI